MFCLSLETSAEIFPPPCRPQTSTKKHLGFLVNAAEDRAKNRIFQEYILKTLVFATKVEWTAPKKNLDLFLGKQIFLAAIGLQQPSNKV